MGGLDELPVCNNNNNNNNNNNKIANGYLAYAKYSKLQYSSILQESIQ